MTAELKILTPKTKEVEVNKDWVASLEEALERAKSGECIGGAVVEDCDEHCRHVVSGLKNRWQFIGHLHHLISVSLDRSPS